VILTLGILAITNKYLIRNIMLYVWNEHWYLTILKYHYFISASTCVCIQNGQKAVKGGYAIENVSLYIYGFSRNEKIHLNSILKYSIVPPNMIIR
jgi:hypothetical protein